MENFYDFIESEAIREHCKKTNYKLDVIECVYLIWDNQNIPIPEKHKLYEEIVSKFEDVVLYDTISFFEELKKHIEAEREMIERFRKDADKKLYARFGGIGKLTTLKKDFCGYVINQKEEIAAYYTNRKICNIQTESRLNKWFMTSDILSLPIPFQKGDIVRCVHFTSKYVPCIFDCLCEEEEDDKGFAYVYVLQFGEHLERMLVQTSKMDFCDLGERVEHSEKVERMKKMIAEAEA